MYQAIYYDRTTYTYHLRDDEKGWLDFKYTPELYQITPNGPLKTLDDYEEGTWTPTFFGSSSAGTTTYNITHNRGTRKVTVQVYDATPDMVTVYVFVPDATP